MQNNTTAQNSTITPQTPILCVDLDGTLICSDVFLISVLLFLRKQPYNFWRLPLWLCRGKGYVKSKLSAHIAHHFHPQDLTYNQHVLGCINRFRNSEAGPVILATGSTEHLAHKIGAHLGCFDQIFASTAQINLIAKNKLRRIRTEYPHNPMIYIGNSNQDLPLWYDSAQAIMVGTHQKREQLIAQKSVPLQILPASNSSNSV